ncbi:PREDICTED: uncharacterized protein LOC108975152 [Bactrocera latifrons]|uniref:uncharacterized protein LOC108975152 n=1 Tax=Bactrocera latifrons TaxID=174628 RepID=UPI0008DD08AD|nr:PREDICTED: uncharacterized protein LOC108975152 [Bactrocera latifrons]
MSKFCGVISKRINSEEVEPLRFSHLEMLTKWLASETESLQSDFAIKSEAVQDMQKQVIQNEQKLIEINGIMEVLKEKVIATEHEVAVNDANIRLLERNIKALEDYANRPLTVAGITCGCPIVHEQQEQRRMLNLLQNTDNTMAQLHLLMNEFQELQPYVQRLSSPYYTISSILDCHASTLKQTENNLDRLVEKLHAVDGMLRLALLHLTASRQQRSQSAPPSFCKPIGDGPANMRNS